MATTPGRHARFIGRVGGLAVALGIGTAIAMNISAAAADDGSSSDGTSGVSTDSSAKSASSGPTAKAERGAVAATDDEDDRPRYSPDRRRVIRNAAADDDESPRSDPGRPPAGVTTRARDGVPTGSDGVSTTSRTSPAAPPNAAEAEEPVAPRVSPLATPEQFAAERTATETANSLPVLLMKVVLRQQFLTAARNLYGQVDEDNMSALDGAVDEYAMAAAFQQQLLDSMNPKVVMQVAPPHTWFGREVPGSRILYDNPDTIYRFMGVNGASEYVITGRFHHTGGAGIPTDVTFSVLEGLAGTTSSLLTYDDLEVNPDGTFAITVSAEPANGRKNHLQLTPGSTIIAARDTLGDWNTEVPMSLSIARVGGPPDSLFAQIGGFAFLGNVVSGNPLLATLVSLIPPLPYLPPTVRGLFAAAILVVRGAGEQTKYMALATRDPQTGAPRPVNTVSQPASNAEFLANQRQSNGHFQLADDQALVLTIHPGRAGYFVVPTYNIWTITEDYWNQPTSRNSKQAKRNTDGTYTVVISPTDPGAANWVSTGGRHQGAIAIRFQDLGAESDGEPRILDQRVLTHDELRDYLPPDAFITAGERGAQLADRLAGFDERWLPYPQP
ncbi:DUF1214 domain-containing protein [Mycolicibacterium sp. F2034L]|uniref:DUF1214 domain-containing protein n=1 Tax=Mycolicibacterium sp. F2034L TaxID=2926422 RepID=UPI001FF12E5E|nr:DUF1214 domain-containing protein [Mycolicibacterium sp. F2034L]MCK0173217.1 DUF1214 domain-containing protein [Mycolicibacterium sp. F2034L]